MQKDKIKVVWICHFSNDDVREKLSFRSFLSNRDVKDYAQWNTNAINEFKKFNDIELHVISPHPNLLSELQEFSKDGIYYHFFRSEDDRFFFRLKRKFLKGRYLTPEYDYNTKIIVSIINTVKPDLIHLIGAENPYYSKSALSMPNDIPLIVALQTLMIDPNFYDNYPISQKVYDYRSDIERRVIQRADYISSVAEKYIKILKKEFEPAPCILGVPLILGEKVNKNDCKKEYDFVYFAKDIEKAIDWAIEAFAIAHDKASSITLNVIGKYSASTKKSIDRRLDELNITDSVTFSGSLPTHDDVINQMRKAKFALLPLKIDLISGTIREAMANGLPVVSTVTPATPILNETRKSILLSEKGDFEDMANNMLRLLEDEDFARCLQSNAYKTTEEKYNNETSAKIWHKAYYAVLDNKNNGTPIPIELLK